MVNGAVSDVSEVISGVPQGSILGPLLFIMYIDDIAELDLSPDTTLIIYADDILLYMPINSPSDYTKLQNDVDTLVSWISHQYLTLNPAKCKAMLISNKKSYAPPSITINQTPIESVREFKYLGVLLTSNLSWSSHVKAVCSKARRLIGMIYRRFYKFCNTATLRQLYVSFVRPHLEYASPVWRPHLKKDIELLEKVQLFACKVCLRMWSGCNYDTALSILNIPRLSVRHSIAQLTLLIKYHKHLCHVPPYIAPLLSISESSLRSSGSFLIPFARTSNHFYSLLSSMRLFNNLPSDNRISILTT